LVAVGVGPVNVDEEPVLPDVVVLATTLGIDDEDVDTTSVFSDENDEELDGEELDVEELDGEEVEGEELDVGELDVEEVDGEGLDEDSEAPTEVD